MVDTKIGALHNRADTMTKFLEGERHHALLATLPLLATTRCRTGLAPVLAIILTTPAAAAEQKELDIDDSYHAVVGWTVVVLVAALAWWLRSRLSMATKPRTRTIAVQTEDMVRTPVRVETRFVTQVPEAIFMTQSGEKFHVTRSCAECRTRGPVRRIERCLVCAPSLAC